MDRVEGRWTEDGNVGGLKVKMGRKGFIRCGRKMNRGKSRNGDNVLRTKG